MLVGLIVLVGLTVFVGLGVWVAVGMGVLDGLMVLVGRGVLVAVGESVDVGVIRGIQHAISVPQSGEASEYSVCVLHPSVLHCPGIENPVARQGIESTHCPCQHICPISPHSCLITQYPSLSH